MDNRLDLIQFLIIVTATSIFWGRINRIGYSSVISSMVDLIMKYSKTNAELIRSYLVWSVYMSVGLVTAVALLTAYQVNLSRFLPLDPRYLSLIPLAFIAQSSLTGLMMQIVIIANRAMDVFSELANVPWVSYTLMMPGVMRMISPLCAAIVEEVFFRGAVFLILTNNFPQTGNYWAIFVCTALFVLQQVLQTDTLGQGLIFFVGSTSISFIGCIVTLYTGSVLPTLLCHATYAVFYFQLGTSVPKRYGRSRRSKPTSSYPHF
jgi:membrane protease YdiL (CAAX protease family)